MVRNTVKSEPGFTLVEMMVIIAVIGTLASIAMPQYQHFVAKARQAEAKVALAAMYTAETSFNLDQLSYTWCLRQAGYVPSATKRFYATGFDGPGPGPGDTCGPAVNQACDGVVYTSNSTPVTCNAVGCVDNDDASSDMQWCATTTLAGTLAGNGNIKCQGPWAPWCYADYNTLEVGAAGYISTSGILDEWAIDQNKQITNLQEGI